MDAAKSRFLDSLNAEFKAATAPVAAPRAQRKPMVMRHWTAAVFAATTSLLFTVPSPAAASTAPDTVTAAAQDCDDFTDPDYVTRDHWKYCGAGSRQYVFKGTTYPGWKVICQNFQVWHWMCGNTKYDAGKAQACKTF